MGSALALATRTLSLSAPEANAVNTGVVERTSDVPHFRLLFLLCAVSAQVGMRPGTLRENGYTGPFDGKLQDC